MADKIKIRRGLLADIPILDEGEFGLVTDRGTVYVGTESSGNILVNPVLAAPDGYTLDGYLYPAVDNVHGLGTPDKRWQSVSVGPGSIHITAKETDPGYTENKEFKLGIDPATGNLQITNQSSVLIELGDDGVSFPNGGGGGIVTTFTADGTWTKPVGAKTVVVYGIGGGGGGGSGRQGSNATLKFGGQGGGGGGARQETFRAEDLPDSVSVVVGSGGTGGISTTNPDTDGSPGGDGTASSFGSFMNFGGGGGGGPAGTAALGLNGGGGGSAIFSAVANTGGIPSIVGNGTSIEGPTGINTTAARSGTWGGGAGGGTNSGNGFALKGNGSVYGGSGGGCGGGISNNNIITVLGAAGGQNPTFDVVTQAGSGLTAQDGDDGLDASVHGTKQGGYGGEGGDAGTGSAPGGIGGNGGVPGGGGGGGGASRNGNSSGAGGDGGRGEVKVYTYF